MNLVAKYVAGSIGNAMETMNVNEEWETKIKDKMPSETTKIIDAICQRFSNDGMLRTCKPKSGKIEPIKYMTDKSKELITDSIGGDSAKTAHDLFLFVPTSTEIKQSGGWGNLFGTKTIECTPENRAEYVQTEQDKFLKNESPDYKKQFTFKNIGYYKNLLSLEIKSHNNSISTHKKFIRNSEEIKKSDPSQKISIDDDIRQYNNTITRILNEIKIKTKQLKLIYDYITDNTNENLKNTLLKEFGKDTQTLEKEFNEKNKCKPEDSIETPNPINIGDMANAALDPYGTAAHIVKEGATDVMSKAKEGATDVQNSAKDAIGDVEKNAMGAASGAMGNAMDDAMGSIPIATAVSAGDVGVNFPETPFGDMSVGDLQGDLMKPREIKDGKAETILNYYTDHIINLLKCDEIVGETLQTKIIDTMFISINNNLKINKRELFSSIAKETTKHCIEKRIALIEPTIKVYQTIISTVPEQILSNYLHLILELFVYNCYNDLLDSEKLGFTTVDLSSHIQTLKGVDGFENKKKELNVDSIAKIMDLNKLPSPKTENKDTEEEEEEKEENNKMVLKKFIELFEKKEKEPEEKKGGARKKYTRKHKRHHKKRRSTRRYR